MASASYLGTAVLPGAGGALATLGGLQLIPPFLLAGTIVLVLVSLILAHEDESDSEG